MIPSRYQTFALRFALFVFVLVSLAAIGAAHFPDRFLMAKPIELWAHANWPAAIHPDAESYVVVAVAPYSMPTDGKNTVSLYAWPGESAQTSQTPWKDNGRITLSQEMFKGTLATLTIPPFKQWKGIDPNTRFLPVTLEITTEGKFPPVYLQTTLELENPQPARPYHKPEQTITVPAASVNHSMPRIEIFPDGNHSFIESQENPAFILITDASNDTPIPHTKLALSAPGIEQPVELTTDASGRAYFTWVSNGYYTYGHSAMRFDVHLLEFTTDAHPVFVHLQQYNTSRMRLASAAGEVNHPFVVHVEPHGEPMVVVLLNDKLTLDARVLPPSKEAEAIEFILPEQAVGLSRIAYLTKASTKWEAEFPFWVLPKAGLPSADVKAQAQVPVSLESLPLEEARQFFHEQTGIPVELLLPHNLETLTALFPLIQGYAKASPDELQILSARFFRDLAPLKLSHPQPTHGIKLALDNVDLVNKQRTTTLFYLLLTCLYGSLLLGPILLMTHPSSRKKDFNKQLATVSIIAFGAGVVCFIVFSTFHHDRMFLLPGGLALTTIAMLGYASYTSRRLSLMGLPFTILLIAGIYAGIVAMEPLENIARYWSETKVIWLFILIPTAMIALTCTGWAFTLFSDRRLKTAIVLQITVGMAVAILATHLTQNTDLDFLRVDPRKPPPEVITCTLMIK